jgi:hypothetical protein
MQKRLSVLGKVAQCALALAFGLAFAVAGFLGGISPLAKQLTGYWQARNYIAVPATVADVSLASSHDSDSGTMYRVDAIFRYQMAGRNYTGGRASLNRGYDNVSDYHARLFAELDAARDQGRQLALWVDPNAPQRAIYDRGLRWHLLVFRIPFAILFPAIALFCVWIAFRVWRSKKNQAPAPLKAGTRIKAADSGAFALFLVAAFWNLLSWPIAIITLAKDGPGVSWLALFILLFPLIGLGMLALAVRIRAKRRRIGDPVLELRGLMPLRGRIHFMPPLGERMRGAPRSQEVSVEVALVKDRGPGEDDTPTTLWQQSTPAVSLAWGTLSHDFQMAVPAPDSDDVGVEVTLKVAGSQVQFLLPRGDSVGMEAGAAGAVAGWQSSQRTEQ